MSQCIGKNDNDATAVCFPRALGPFSAVAPSRQGALPVTDVRITSVRVVDLRFPTSRESIGSDAVNKDPDYSAAYCILETNSAFEGHGLTFTLGRGTDLVA